MDDSTGTWSVHENSNYFETMKSRESALVSKIYTAIRDTLRSITEKDFHNQKIKHCQIYIAKEREDIKFEVILENHRRNIGDATSSSSSFSKQVMTLYCQVGGVHYHLHERHNPVYSQNLNIEN